MLTSPKIDTQSNKYSCSDQTDTYRSNGVEILLENKINASVIECVPISERVLLVKPRTLNRRGLSY